MQVRSKGKEQNTGTYQCIAKNSVGTARSHNVTVQVASKHLSSSFMVLLQQSWKKAEVCCFWFVCCC